MGLGPLGGTAWGGVLTALGTAMLFGAGAIGAVYIAVSVAGYVVLSVLGML